MLMTVAQLMDQCLFEIPGKDQNSIIYATNLVLRRIYTEFVEPKRGTFTTTAKVVTGTVAVTQGSAVATFSNGVVLTTDPQPRLAQILGDPTWFGLTRGAGNSDGVLSSAWATTSNATATYTICYPAQSLPSDVGEVLAIWRDPFNQLKFALHERDTSWLWQSGVGVPMYWCPYQHDESAANPNDDRTRVLLSPASQDAVVYTFSYKPRHTYLDPTGATSQTIPLTDLWGEAIVQGVLFFLWKQDAAKEKALLASSLYEAALARTRGAQLPGAIIPPRGWGSGGLYAIERRPIGGN